MSMRITIRIGEREYNFMVIGKDVCQTLDELKQFVYCRFPQLGKDKDLSIYWFDGWMDVKICIMTDGDYRNFLLATDGKNRYLNVDGSETTQEDAAVGPNVQNASDDASNATRPVHSAVICDVCDQLIVGHRYRCLTCHNYDLCMTCEGKYRHKEHIMLRIPRPAAGPRLLTRRVLENIERAAGNLKLSPEVPPQQDAYNGDVGGSFLSQSCSGRRHITTANRSKRCGRVPEVSAMHKANAAASAMAHERVQARIREVFSRYVDPANITDNVGSASLSSTLATPPKEKANVGPFPPQSTAQEGVLTEAQRSIKLASEAAKVASAAAAASWNTFMGCAGMFVPVMSSPSSSTSATGTAGNQNATPKETKSEVNDGTGTASNASVVSGLVGEVLKHTPPELKELLPKEEEMTRLGENLSTLLSQLGIELPKLATEAGEAISSLVAHSKDTHATTLEEQPAGAEGEKQKENKAESQSCNNKPLLETDSVAVGNHSSADIKLAEEHKEPAVDQDQCSADTSSASLLTDDDEDVVGAAQISEQANPPVASSSRTKNPWILVDLPDDREEAVKPIAAKPLTATSASRPVGASTPSTSLQNEDKSVEGEKSDNDDEIALLDLLNLLERKKLLARKQSAQDKREACEKLDNALQKLKNQLYIQLKEDRQQQTNQENVAAASVSEPANERKPSPVPSSTSSEPSTSAPIATNEATMAEPSTQSAAPLGTYSLRPHVNHAIHAMMTMGFSNNEGHLTQLLEALDGDIHQALDLLMQKLS